MSHPRPQILTATGALRAWWSLAMVLVVAVIVSGAGIFYTAHNQQVSNSRFKAVTDRLDSAQATQRVKALCPLYQIFIDSERFTPPNQSPAQAAMRVHAFQVIHASYDALNCKQYLNR